MNKKTLSIPVAALLAISGSFFCPSTMALEIKENPYDSYCRTPILEQFGEIDRTQTVTINGIENPLYCTFTDNDAALEKLKDSVPEILSEISEKFSLGELNANNWKSYKYGALSLPETSKFADEANEQRRTLAQFFDIYEDVEKNESIELELAKIRKHDSLSQEQIISLGMLLPSHAPLAEQSQDIIMARNQIGTLSLPNLNAAISYAQTYAVNPNTNGYGIAKGGFLNLIEMDCTNFVSQILEASGVSQAVYNVDTMGWWHRKNGNNHTYSVSWINSDTFARYMGVGYTSTNNHLNFSRNITTGDFITYDETNNGSWDHMAFVTDMGSELCYQNGTYRDYKVAQHTTNYHKWAHETAWPTVAAKYGRVRR